MPVHFANNWFIARTEGEDSQIIMTFWLDEKVQKLYANQTSVEKVHKKKTKTIYFHKILLNKLNRSKQFDGWIIQPSNLTITFHENRRDYVPIINKKAQNDDDDDDDDYVKIKREFKQTVDEINDIITPPPVEPENEETNEVEQTEETNNQELQELQQEINKQKQELQELQQSSA